MSTKSQVVFGIETVVDINQIGDQNQININNPNNTDVNS